MSGDLQGGHFIPMPPGSILLGPDFPIQAYPDQSQSSELKEKVEALEEKVAEQQKQLAILYKLVRDLQDALPAFAGGLNSKVIHS